MHHSPNVYSCNMETENPVFGSGIYRHPSKNGTASELRFAFFLCSISTNKSVCENAASSILQLGAGFTHMCLQSILQNRIKNHAHPFGACYTWRLAAPLWVRMPRSPSCRLLRDDAARAERPPPQPPCRVLGETAAGVASEDATRDRHHSTV